MKRIPEPELMDDPDQARAYAEADFDESNSLFVDQFLTRFPEAADGRLLDLGCGPADIAIRLAQACPRARVDGVDGAAEMLAFGRARLDESADLAARVTLIEGLIPTAALPASRYDAVISNSLLHHLHAPHDLWVMIAGLAPTTVMIMDLFRPQSNEEAQNLVDTYAADAPEVLRRDFYLSLLAAFTPDEVSAQLSDAGLEALQVETVSDRHMLICGRLV